MKKIYSSKTIKKLNKLLTKKSHFDLNSKIKLMSFLESIENWQLSISVSMKITKRRLFNGTFQIKKILF